MDTRLILFLFISIKCFCQSDTVEMIDMQRDNNFYCNYKNYIFIGDSNARFVFILKTINKDKYYLFKNDTSDKLDIGEQYIVENRKKKYFVRKIK